MAQVYVIGRITADLEFKTSEKKTPYVRFDIAENIGNRQNLRTQYYQVCAWNDDAGRLKNAKAKKGSLIWVSGSLELEVFTKRDGVTVDKRMKILLDNWGFIPVGAAKTNNEGFAKNGPSDTSPQEFEGIDGDRDTLPG